LTPAAWSAADEKKCRMPRCSRSYSMPVAATTDFSDSWL
jgi:hypothetical protein